MHETEEEHEVFLDMASAAFYQVLGGHSIAAREYLERLSFWEIGQVEVSADRMRQVARELLAQRVKT